MRDGSARLWAPSNEARVASAFAANYFVVGLVTPFLPMWFETRGFTVAEIGLLTTLPAVLRSAAAPAVGFLADKHEAHRRFAIALAALGVVAWLLLSAATTFAVAMTALLVGAISGTYSVLVETIAMAGVRRAGHDYGRMRLWGSAAFVVASVTGGFIAARSGSDAVMRLMVAGAIATLGVVVLLPRPVAADLAGAPSRRLALRDVRALVAMPAMQMLLLSAGTLQGAHGMFYAYGTIHWQSQAIPTRWFGILWAIGIITEIALFWYSARVLNRLRAVHLLLVAGALSALRWTVMAFDPPLLLLVPLQLAHGITFGASHLGAMHVLNRIAPPDRSATAQSLYALVSTLGIVLATTVAARLYPSFGGLGYLAMAAMALVGLLAALRLRTLQAT
jgi:MFS transporter, PPP family, 3-phenylpropionic acid transporter